MVAGGGERIFKASIDGLFIVVDEGGLAVHKTGSADNFAAEGVGDGLMAKTDAQDRDFTGEVAHHIIGYAGLFWGAGPGRDDDMRRALFFYLLHGNLIIPVDLNLSAERADGLNQIVGKGIVVV